MVTADGDRIRRMRVEQGMSQLELAGRAGITQGTVCKVELGRSCRPGTLRMIAVALGTTPAALLMVAAR